MFTWYQKGQVWGEDASSLTGRIEKTTPLYGNPRFIHHPWLFQCLGDGSRFTRCGVPRVQSKIIQHFLCHPKTHEFPYHQVTPIRDRLNYPKLTWKATFFLKGSPATNFPLKGHKKWRIFSEVQRCRWTAYSGSQCPYPSHPMGRGSIFTDTFIAQKSTIYV